MELTIAKNTEEIVLIAVNYEDIWDRMSQAGFTGKEAYIKVTKGLPNVMSLYDNEANHYYSFEFGQKGCTVISEETNKLKNHVLSFLSEKKINIEEIEFNFDFAD